MLSVPAKVRIFLCTCPIDMRKGFDGLHGVVLEVLRQDPLSGDLFVFLNRRHDRVKLLIWEGDGMLIVYKKHETENTQMLGFTEVERLAHNRGVGFVEAGQVV